MTTHYLDTPLTDDAIRQLRAGDEVFLVRRDLYGATPRTSASSIPAAASRCRWT